MWKIDKQPSLSVKTLKNMTPGKDGKWFSFKFEILATNIDQSHILKNICQQLLLLNNVLNYVGFYLLEQYMNYLSTKCRHNRVAGHDKEAQNTIYATSCSMVLVLVSVSLGKKHSGH